MRLLITETYGGKIDDEGDFSQLRALVNRFITRAAFDDGFKLVDGENGLGMPDKLTMRDFMAWVSDELPEREPPTYLGLPANAEKLLLIGHGKRMIEDLSKMRDILDEGEELMESP